MKIVFKHLIGGAALALGMTVMAAPTAHATVLDFSFSGSGGGITETASWSMDSNPSVVSFASNNNTEVTVSGGTEFRSDLGTSTFPTVQFFALGSPSGVEFSTNGLAFNVLDRFGTGSQIYTGLESAPVFAPGTFVGTSGTLTITDAVAAVPELSSWAMLVLGFLGLGLIAHRRKSGAPQPA